MYEQASPQLAEIPRWPKPRSANLWLTHRWISYHNSYGGGLLCSYNCYTYWCQIGRQKSDIEGNINWWCGELKARCVKDAFLCKRYFSWKQNEIFRKDEKKIFREVTFRYTRINWRKIIVMSCHVTCTNTCRTIV